MNYLNFSALSSLAALGLAFFTAACDTPPPCIVPDGYKGINSLADFKAINDDISKNYILCTDINLAGESWTNGFGGASIQSGFSGKFDGNGHTVSGLTISVPAQSVTSCNALFEATTSTAEIRNLKMTDVNINVSAKDPTRGLTSYTGALVGMNAGLISNVTIRGQVQAKGLSMIGGVVGTNTGRIESASFDGSVKGASWVGGLVGSSNSYLGISDAYSLGQVEGAEYVGGLVGSGMNVEHCFSSATVTQTGTGRAIGGLVGHATSTVTDSFAIGNVTGSDLVGGLIGYNLGTVERSYAAGSVRGVAGRTAQSIGGLIGAHAGLSAHLKDAYSTGAVDTSVASSSQKVGGLIGSNTSSLVSRSYTTSAVTPSVVHSDIGGLVGSSKHPMLPNQPALTEYSYYLNRESTLIPSAGGTPKTLAELRTRFTYLPQWDISATSSPENTLWKINEGLDTPQLRSN